MLKRSRNMRVHGGWSEQFGISRAASWIDISGLTDHEFSHHLIPPNQQTHQNCRGIWRKIIIKQININKMTARNFLEGFCRRQRWTDPSPADSLSFFIAKKKTKEEERMRKEDGVRARSVIQSWLYSGEIRGRETLDFCYLHASTGTVGSRKILSSSRRHVGSLLMYKIVNPTHLVLTFSFLSFFF